MELEDKKNTNAIINLIDGTEIKVQECNSHYLRDDMLHFHGKNYSRVLVPLTKINFISFMKEQ